VEISKEARPYGVLVGVCSRLDILTAKELQEVVDEAFEAGARSVVFDFSAVEYVSSSGLRVLLSTRKLARARSGGTVVLCSVGAFVGEVLTTTGFDKLFRICADVAEAEAVVSEV
jgi:anti-anti-sigma factor